MNKKLLLLTAIIGAIAFVFILNMGDTGDSGDDSTNGFVEAPIDIVSSFYNDWFDAVESTTTDPYAAGLTNDARLLPSVQSYIADTQGIETEYIDSVLCLSQMPPRVGVKKVFEVENQAQYMVLARGVGPTPDRAVVDLTLTDEGWKISAIQCVHGESAPVQEYTFDRTGSLLKGGQEPLSADTWYIVFEEDGQAGHFAPLLLDTASMCVINEGEAMVCDATTFNNTSLISVQGDMSESGVIVERIEFLSQ